MKIVSTDRAPRAIGHYSQAVRTNGLLFLAGQIAIDPETAKVISDDVAKQTEQIMKNVERVLAAENLNLSSIVKATVFLKDIATFPEFNRVYAEMLGDHKPARSLVEVSNLPKGVSIEIEVIAEAD